MTYSPFYQSRTLGKLFLNYYVLLPSDFAHILQGHLSSVVPGTGIESRNKWLKLTHIALLNSRVFKTKFGAVWQKYLLLVLRHLTCIWLIPIECVPWYQWTQKQMFPLLSHMFSAKCVQYILLLYFSFENEGIFFQVFVIRIHRTCHCYMCDCVIVMLYRGTKPLLCCWFFS